MGAWKPGYQPPCEARNPRGINQHSERRQNHRYDDPTVGRILTAIFAQPLTGETRTVEIVRYAGGNAWKARVRETRSVVNRHGQQVEFAGDQAGATDMTEYLTRKGMQIIRRWESILPEWSAAAVPAEQRPMISGGVQQ